MFLVTIIIITKKPFKDKINILTLKKKYYSDNIGCHKYYIFSHKINILILKTLYWWY